jgi:hypothetical protein
MDNHQNMNNHKINQHMNFGKSNFLKIPLLGGMVLLYPPIICRLVARLLYFGVVHWLGKRVPLPPPLLRVR